MQNTLKNHKYFHVEKLIQMHQRCAIVFFLFLIAVMTVSLVYADSCPYCGRQYGDAAPGDEGRVYSLRQQHEAECSLRPRAAAGDKGSSGRNMHAAEIETEEKRIREQEEEMRLRQDKEKARREQIKRINRVKKEVSKQQGELEANKKSLLSSLKSAAPAASAEMPVINPLDLKGQEKGLTIKAIPSPQETRKKNLPLFAKKTGDIILEALEAGNKNLDASIQFLEDNLKKYPDTYGIKEALSCLEGMRAGAAYEEKKRSPFTPGDEDANLLMEVVAERAQPAWPWSWPWQRSKESAVSQEDSTQWKKKRTELFLEALEKGNKDLDKSIAYLEHQKKGDNWETARQSLEYLHGFFSYKEYLDTHKGKE